MIKIQRNVCVGITGLKCESCGGMDFILDKSGEEICSSCGYVVMKKIEEGPEWRSFEGEEESKVRVGMPPTLMMQDKGLSTVIGRENEDSAGKKIVGKAKRDLNRLRKWQWRINIYSSKDRNLSSALNELNKLGEKLGVPFSILEKASYIYRMALEKGLVRGRAINSIVSASLYAALRYDGIPKTLKELSKASHIEKKELAKCYRMLVKEMRLQMPLVDPNTHVRKICVYSGINKMAMIGSEKIIRLAQKKKLTAGKDPMGLAAAAVYYSCVLLDIKTTQRDIAIAANITEVTVRNRYKSLSDQLKLEEPVSLEDLK